jgi:hypothetical protein
MWLSSLSTLYAVTPKATPLHFPVPPLIRRICTVQIFPAIRGVDFNRNVENAFADRCIRNFTGSIGWHESHGARKDQSPSLTGITRLPTRHYIQLSIHFEGSRARLELEHTTMAIPYRNFEELQNNLGGRVVRADAHSRLGIPALY